MGFSLIKKWFTTFPISLLKIHSRPDPMVLGIRLCCCNYMHLLKKLKRIWIYACLVEFNFYLTWFNWSGRCPACRNYKVLYAKICDR